MKLNIPIEVVFDDVNSVIDELKKLQKYKLGEGDDMTLVNIDDIVDVLTRHVMAREAKEPCGTKEGWIPCSERMPDYGEVVLWCNKHGSVFASAFTYQSVDYFSVGKHGGSRTITAWMPLPKPYGGESE